MLDLGSVGGRCGLQQIIIGRLKIKSEFPEAFQKQKRKVMDERERDDTHSTVSCTVLRVLEVCACRVQIMVWPMSRFAMAYHEA